jgi:hypothetical protein
MSDSKSSTCGPRHSERDQLDLLRALPGGLAPRDVQHLMAYPFFSVAKSKRIAPIDFRAGTITIRVEAVPEHGMATIWDADVLTWAASQIVEACDAGLKTSRLMAATSYEILTLVGRGTSVRDCERLKAALDRLQATSAMISIRQSTRRRRHRFLDPIHLQDGCSASATPARLRFATTVLPQPRLCLRFTGDSLPVGTAHKSLSTIRSGQLSDLTTVELLWLDQLIENRVRFGQPVSERIIDRHRRALSFAPGSIFAFVRWTSNDFGTVLSRIDILRAAIPGQRYSTVPWVHPGGESLLRLFGWPKVERVLQLVDAVEALGINPADAAPDYWHHVHNRLSVNETPRTYTLARHQAWLRRRRVAL